MDDFYPSLRVALADRYRIDRVLGRGGMGIVFLAEDLKHGRQVALKVLRPELAQTLGGERFLREIRITAALNHHNILLLIDSGHAAGLMYYVLPYVAGESLRDRLTREAQLPIDDALRIARETADALGFAHEHGIVHRDIKPENILLEAGHAVLADFGIATVVGRPPQLAKAADGTTDPRLTGAGQVVGTPAYMSPEQASGDAIVDGRSDLYSLACVLYEALTGNPPFPGSTAQATIARRFQAPPDSIRAQRPEVPVKLAGTIERALSLDPADRFGSMAEFATALTTAAQEQRLG